ncbi:MAG TPA: extracellular solute-binding protein, partial [Chloroflexota bacterium]|nr:extracellular solute-binding protein [Chloroflexota bacterium]
MGASVARRSFLRSTGALVLSGAGGAMLAACGATPVPEIAPTRSYTAPKPGKLTVQMDGTWETHRALRERLLPAFERRHAGISVTLTTGIADMTVLKRQAASNRAPDVVLFGPSQAPAVADTRLTVPLDSRLGAWGYQGDLVPVSLVSSQWAGKQWGLPLSMDVRLHLWRRSLLADARLDRPPATWEEVVEAVRAGVLVERGAIAREGYPRPDGWSAFAAALLSFGRGLFAPSAAASPSATAGSAPTAASGTSTNQVSQTTTPGPAAQLDIAGPEGQAALAHLLAIFRATRPAGALTGRTRPAAYPFATGTLAHTVDNATPLRALEQTFPAELDNVLVGDPPLPGAGVSGAAGGSANGKQRPVTLVSSEWLGILSSSQAQDQAWAFVQYLMEPSSLLAINETRYLRTPRKSLSAAKYLRTPHLERMIELSDKYAVPMPRVPDATLFRDSLRSTADDAFTGRVTPEQA